MPLQGCRCKVTQQYLSVPGLQEITINYQPGVIHRPDLSLYIYGAHINACTEVLAVGWLSWLGRLLVLECRLWRSALLEQEPQLCLQGSPVCAGPLRLMVHSAHITAP